MITDSRITQATLLPKYAELLRTVELTKWSKAEAQRIAKAICHHQERYQAVSKQTGAPWQWIGTLHHMECGGNFGQHLANGDPIDAPTVQVPAGIPAGTWEECAVAALALPGKDYRLDNMIDWGPSAKTKILWRTEAYNGFGYRLYRPEVLSPYLWSGTNHYKSGKYVADGKWSADAVSAQVGAVPILMELGLLEYPQMPDQAKDYQVTMNGEYQQQFIPKGTVNKILKFTHNSYLKDRPVMSTQLRPEELKPVLDGQPVIFAERLPDVNGHYAIKSATGKVYYVFSGHAGFNAPEEEQSALFSSGSGAGAIDPKDKKAVQKELSRVGLLDGRKGFDDGKWGALSESAMRAWKRHYGSDDMEKALAGLQQAKGYRDLDLRPKDPSKASHAIAAACLKRMLELDMWLAVSFGSESPTWNFFYLSGTNMDGSFNKDSIDNMNDLRLLAKINPDGTVEVGYISVATWDAGWKYRKDRMNSNGCFQVDYDKQFWSWRPGTHGTAAPHAALTQQDDGDALTGTRDNDENGRTPTDKHYADGGAINHHGTVGRKPGQPIGPYSAGCGVDDDIDAHLKIFMPRIKSDRRSKASYGHLISCCFLKRDHVKGLPLK
jgi:lysozyme family protein